MQSDVPNVALKQALRVPKAIADQYAAKPTKPLHVAAALGMQPTSGPFKALCGASIAYGLTIGGYHAGLIELTELGKRIVRPTREGDDTVASREAFLRPRVLGEFLGRYNSSPVPKREIGINVLDEMGVPRERGQKTLELIESGARELGLIHTIKGKDYVSLDPVEQSPGPDPDNALASANGNGPAAEDGSNEVPRGEGQHEDGTKRPNLEARKRRVFVAHGKNTSFLTTIKKLLRFGELEAVVSAEQSTVSQPVPDKVLADMRSCGAAILHVDAERVLMDSGANEHVVLNENVLIEIGAAMALYGRRFILLVKNEAVLPSNLQGVYEVRYDGDELGTESTIGLLEAINDIKNNSLPDEG